MIGVTGSVVTLVAAPLFHVEEVAWGILLTGMIALGLSNAYLLWVASAVERYTEPRLLVIWTVATFGVGTATVFFGPLSAAACALILGIYVAGRNASRRVAWATYLTAAGTHGLAALLPLVTPLPRVGHLEPRGIGVLEIVVAELLVQLIFAGTHAAASSSRRAMGRILSDLERAIRVIARREVQLEEAREEFLRAMPIGGAGRLTGSQLGSFELGVLIGRGGMGEVYEVAGADGAEAAVKVLLKQALADEGAVTRFLREARAASSLDSPHVVKVLEFGEPPAELPYIAMERLRGLDLSTHLRERGGVLKPAEGVELVRQIGRGLSAARDAGIVHRDIKPQNLYRVALGTAEAVARWTILDFGISKLGESSGTLTHGRLLGTPTYMAPEQAVGQAVDHRADLYSLAAVAYRCLVGRPPFRRGDTARVVYRVVNQMPPRPSAHAELPDGVDHVFRIALAKDPADRFADASELARALEAALDGAVDDALRRRARALCRALDWSR